MCKYSLLEQKDYTSCPRMGDLELKTETVLVFDNSLSQKIKLMQTR